VERLILAMKTVLSGCIFLDDEPWALLKWKLMPLIEHDDHLNAEERSIVPLLLKGLTSKEIAEEIQKTSRRVDKVRGNMMRKLGVHNATGLISKLSHPDTDPS
jgi:DNA-binding NarL/FixJ family response regulator